LKNITITGSEGIIGRQLCSYLKNKYKIIKLDLKFGHDLSDEGFVKKWFQKNHSNYLINCFALNDHISSKRKKETLMNMSLDTVTKYLDTNITSLFSVCREFARNNKQGGIINFSSYLGIVSPNPILYGKTDKNIAYCVSKAGVIHLTKYLAVHLAPNIQVNCISPGGILDRQEKNFVKKYSELTPMKRMMKKTELNGIVDFLCSDTSKYVTGSNFIIDGGYTSW